MRSHSLLLAALVAVSPLAAQAQTQQASVRRVAVSLAFAGEDVLIYGQAPGGTAAVLSVLEGPEAHEIRLMEKGRVALFWMGVHQYRLGGVPGLYLVATGCPACNGLGACEHGAGLDAWNAALAPLGITVGPAGIAGRAKVEAMSGEVGPEESARVVEGFWQLQADRGLYAVKPNATRLNAASTFYLRFPVPTQAPDGRYVATTYFLGAQGIIDTVETELFVRKTGVVASLTRLAERNGMTYGFLAVGIAIAAGWVAGTLFRKGGGH